MEEEEFERKLRRLSMMSPKQKRKHLKNIEKREDRFVENHTAMNMAIESDRKFMRELEQEEEE